MVPNIYSATESFDVGCDFGSPASEEYAPPFLFTGEIKKITIDITGKPHRDVDAELRTVMTRE